MLVFFGVCENSMLLWQVSSTYISMQSWQLAVPAGVCLVFVDRGDVEGAVHTGTVSTKLWWRQLYILYEEWAYILR